MVLFASQVSQQIYQSQLAMAQQQQHAQMLSMQMGTMPQITAYSAARTGQGGMYGEQLAGGMANAGRTMMGLGGLGLGLAGAITGAPFDPFSAAMAGGGMGWSMAGGAGLRGAMGALGGAGLAAAPFLLAGQAMDVYGGAFHGGMRQQAQTNSVLRNSFNFSGGQGSLGRGFSQGQMGQIGSLIAAETARSPFTSSQELNQLIQTGAESGMFTAVRDVESFTRRFRTMLDGLKKIQKEIGGTLSEALQFTRGTQQLGIWSTGGRTAFASEMRDTMANTGMDQGQLFSLAATGSMLSRATGGVGRQGAVGALRAARQIGSAVNSGILSPEMLSEMTGGLQGADAINAFTTSTLQRADQHSRTAVGRYGMFALSNARGTGLNQEMLARYRMGDVSIGELMRGAHERVGGMGRARALNQEGFLRGALMEQGGLSTQIMDMRLRLGDRVMDRGDEVSQYVMRRRYGMGAEEARGWSTLMRNQGQIAANEQVESSMAKGQMQRQHQVSARGIDQFVAQLEHGLQDATGVTAARTLGRTFLTKISSLAERTMNEFLGIQTSALSVGDRQAITRISMGMGTNADRALVTAYGGAGAGPSGGDPFARSLSSRTLEGISSMSGGLLHFDTPQSIGQIMQGRGVNFSGMSLSQRQAAIASAEQAQGGAVFGRDAQQYDHLMGNAALTRRRMMVGSLNGGAGMRAAFGSSVSMNAIDAARVGLGISPVSGLNPEEAAGDVSAMTGLGRVLSSVGRGAARGWDAGMNVGLGGAVYGGYAGGLYGAYKGIDEALYTSREKGLSYIASGGHLGEFGRMAGQELFTAAQTGKLGAVAKSLGKAATKRGTTLGMAMSVGEATRGGKITAETMDAVVSSASFQGGIRALASGLKGPAQEAELEKLRIAANSMPEDQKAAATVAIEQLEDNLKRNGKVGKEFASVTMTDQKRREMLGEFSKMGGRYANMLKGLGPNNALAGVIQDVAEGWSRAGTGGGTTGAFASQDELVRALSESDVKSVDYQKAVEALGQDAGGQGVIMAASARRQGVRELSGGGRLGRRGSASSAFELLTGGQVGSMEFELSNGRVVNKNQAQTLYRLFAKGGKDADLAEKQLVAQLKSAHVDKAEEYVAEMRKSIASKGIDKAEAGSMIDKLTKDENLQAVRQKGLEAVQRANDPLGVHRNELLGKILTAVNKSAGIVADDITLTQAM